MHGYVDALLEFINVSSSRCPALEGKLLHDCLHRGLQQEIRVNLDVSNPYEHLLQKKKIALLIYFSTLPCSSQQRPAYQWTWTKQICQKTVDFRYTTSGGLGLKRRKVYTKGYPTYYALGNPNKTWGSMQHTPSQGVEGALVWALAGRGVAPILGHMRREAREFPELQCLHEEVMKVLKDTEEGDKLDPHAAKLCMMHTCHDKRCMSLKCLQWGSPSENSKEAWKRKRDKEASVTNRLPRA